MWALMSSGERFSKETLLVGSHSVGCHLLIKSLLWWFNVLHLIYLWLYLFIETFLGIMSRVCFC